MKKILHYMTLGIAVLCFSNLDAQTRYQDQIFTSNQVQEDVSFGFNVDPLRSNFSDLAAFGADMAAVNAFMEAGEDVPLNYFLSNGDLPAEQQTALKLFPLQMDIYSPPAEDSETARPVIVVLHTGNFLPPVINGGPTGSRKDSTIVNLSKQWARSGYVVAAMSYRLGWNPVSTDADTRRGTLLQAVYRALHDAQTGVRFMRATAGQGNPYAIDPSKIALFGQGSGGYVAQAYNTLNDYNTEVAIPKFIGEDGLPYVIEAIDGNIDGGPGLTRLPDPLQQLGISKEISVSGNIGGALADISWLDAGEAPMVSLHCIRDPFAPFDNGTVVVPTTNEDVVDVSGANVFIQEAVNNGNNSAFLTIPEGNDPFTDRARSLYGQTFDYILASQPTITVSPNPEGLFPVLVPINTLNGNRFTNESGPWDWWDFNTLTAVVAGTNAALGLSPGDPGFYDVNVIHGQSLAGNPGMGPEKGLAYIDTIQGYMNPRFMCAMDLEGAPCTVGISENELQSNTNVYPNPTAGTLNIRNNDQVIRRVELYDITGRIVAERIVNANFYSFERTGLRDGVYLMQIVFDNQRITKKVLFN